MHEYIALGHIKLTERAGEYFILHHVVVKRKDNDLKILVIFDTSASFSSKRSLNDYLGTGPQLQKDIGDILLRSRFNKLYRQLFVHEKDHIFQHLLWRRSTLKVQEYELCTVTYDLNLTLFLSIHCLLQLEKDNSPEFTSARQFFRFYIYLDDIITGTNTVKIVLKVECQVVGLLQKGCFELK